MSFVVNDSCLESLSAIAAQHEDWIIQQAIALLEKRVFKAGAKLLDPTAVRDYLRVKLVAEPWDVSPGGWQTGSHPPPMAEWNDRFRDGVRAFWRGDNGQIGTLANPFVASE